MKHSLTAWIQKREQRCLQWIQAQRRPWLEKIMELFSCWGEWGALWLFIGTGLLFRQTERGLLLIGCVAFCGILCKGWLKPAFHRQRPPTERQNLPPPTQKQSFSFPSGHSMASFAAAGLLAQWYGAAAAAVFLLALLISLSRLYLGEHYPGDVLAGAIFGSVAAKLWLFLARVPAAWAAPWLERLFCLLLGNGN